MSNCIYDEVSEEILNRELEFPIEPITLKMTLISKSDQIKIGKTVEFDFADLRSDLNEEYIGELCLMLYGLLIENAKQSVNYQIFKGRKNE